jgi:Fe-Mn family superoxide dismutase
METTTHTHEGNGGSAAYRAKQFDLSGLQGISDQTLEMHFRLYEGYVKNTNVLTEQIDALLADGRIDREEMPAYSELTRRLGFEYNGMVLHEYYFGNLTRQGGGDAPAQSAFRRATETAGGYARWKTDFTSVGQMRGVGWAICYLDPANGRLSNHWVTLHEVGNVAGFVPVLVMDVWEHAYLLDYKPAEKGKYIDAFFANVDWAAVDRRITAASHERG